VRGLALDREKDFGDAKVHAKRFSRKVAKTQR
jgi:hypothetical protein